MGSMQLCVRTHGKVDGETEPLLNTAEAGSWCSSKSCPYTHVAFREPQRDILRVA